MLEIFVGAAILFVGVVVGFSLAKSDKAKDEVITSYNGDVIHNYGEMPQELTYDEGTLFKVRKVLADELGTSFLNAKSIDDVITGFQNAGILFRERAK